MINEHMIEIKPEMKIAFPPKPAGHMVNGLGSPYQYYIPVFKKPNWFVRFMWKHCFGLEWKEYK